MHTIDKLTYEYVKTILDGMNCVSFTFSFFRKVEKLIRLERVYLEECEASHRVICWQANNSNKLKL